MRGAARVGRVGSWSLSAGTSGIDLLRSKKNRTLEPVRGFAERDEKSGQGSARGLRRRQQGACEMAAVKLAYFFVERAAEPLSARLESYAARSERFRSACGGLANWYNTIEYRKGERHRARTINTTAAHQQLHGLGQPVAPTLSSAHLSAPPVG